LSETPIACGFTDADHMDWLKQTFLESNSLAKEKHMA